MKHFDRLYKTIMEEVKPSKHQRRHIIKEDAGGSGIPQIFVDTLKDVFAANQDKIPALKRALKIDLRKGWGTSAWGNYHGPLMAFRKLGEYGFNVTPEQQEILGGKTPDGAYKSGGRWEGSFEKNMSYLLNLLGLSDIDEMINTKVKKRFYNMYPELEPDEIKELPSYVPRTRREKRYAAESVKKPVRKYHVIKESISIQEEMDAIRVAADIIKRAMAVNKDEVLERLEEDVNYDSSCCAFEDYDGEGITREMWENSIKYGWMAETLPYFIDWQDDLFEDIEITPEERAILEKADNNAYVFSDEFEKGNLEGLDFCKEICSQFDVDIYPEELMIRFAGEDDEMAEESVKKPVSKKKVIKESAKRPVRRHIRRQIKK